MILPAKVNKRAALAFAGYGGRNVDPAIQERLDSVAALCEEELQATGVFAVFDVVSNSAEGVLLAGCDLLLPGAAIAQHLKGCTAAALQVVTMGAASEMLVRRVQAGSAVDGLLANACAASMAEEAARLMYLQVKAYAAERGLQTVRRFSPGYEDFPLSVQPAFLAASGANRALGVSTNEANFLVPSKSTSAVVGLKV